MKDMTEVPSVPEDQEAEGERQVEYRTYPEESCSIQEDQSTGEGQSHVEDAEESSSEDQEEEPTEGQMKDKIRLKEDFEGSQTSDMTPEEGSEDDSAPGAEVESETEDMPHPEQCDQLCFQETLVDTICVAMFPTQSVVNSLGGVIGWSQAASLLLSMMGRMSSDVPAVHYLRVCHDYASLVVVPESLEPFSLFVLGDLGRIAAVEDGLYLDSHACFDEISALVENQQEKGTSHDKLQEFLVLFFGRCIDSNPDTPVLGSILYNIAATTDSFMLKFVGPIIHRLLLMEEEVSQGAFEEVLQNPDAVKEHPALEDISSAFAIALEEDAEMALDFPCAVMCCDLIGEVAFQGIDLTTVSGSENPLLVNLRTATRIVTDSIGGEDIFRLLCAVAYLRSFLSSVARLVQKKPACMLQNGEFAMLLNDVNAAIMPSESGLAYPRKSAIRMFLLRELRKKLSLYDVRELCKRNVRLSALKAIQWQDQDSSNKLSFDPFEVSHNTPAEAALANLLAKKDEGSMTGFLKTLKGTRDSRIELAVVLIKAFYLVRSTRSLKDTEDKAAETIMQLLNAEGLPKPFTELVQCILGKKDFKAQDLKLSPESSVSLVNRTALVLHLGIILASHLGHDKNFAPPFLSYFMDPPKSEATFVLAAPESLETGYQPFCHYHAKMSPGVQICLCSCGMAYAYVDVGKTVVCPSCQKKCKAKAFDEDQHLQVTTPATKGYVPQGIKDMQEDILCVRDMGPIEFRMLHLLVHSALFTGYSLQLFDDAALRKFMSNDTQHEEASDACFRHISNDLQALCNLLNVEEDSVLKLMHQVLQVTTPFFTQNMQLTSEASRTSWESGFAEAVAPLLHETGTAKWKSNTGEACEVSQPSVEQQLSESHIHVFEDTKSRNMHLPRLFRATQPKTFNSLRAFYLNVNDQVKKHHPLVGLFLDHSHTLPLIRHLSSLLNWSRIVDSQQSRKLSRRDAKKLHISDAIREARASNRESWKKMFDDFKRSWEAVRPLVMKELGSDKEMPHLSEASPIACCLVERRGDGVFLCTALELLQKLQNGFLEKVLAISSTGACAALSFLQKGDSVSAISMVHLQDARKKEIIHYQWINEILRHSQRDVEYGLGSEIFYDLGRIERELALRFLPDVAFLATENGLRGFVFAKELFHTCSNILNDLQQIIPQMQLTPDIKSGLRSMNEQKNIQDLLEHLEIVLVLLKRTGGNPEQPLVEFTNQWQTSSRPFPKSLLPEPHTAVRLTHVVSLYECLEDIFAVSSVESVNDRYRNPLLSDVKDDLVKVVNSPSLKAEGVSLDVIITALRRFMFRFLLSEDMKPDPGGELTESMMEPSLWPMGSFKEGTPQQVCRLIPSSLTIGHVHSVLSFYQEQVQVRILLCHHGKVIQG